MPEPRPPENFSTTLLSMLFSLLRENESRETILDLRITTVDGSHPIREFLPLSNTTRIYMCRDLWSVWEGGKGAPEYGMRLYAGKKPDVWCEDDNAVLFVENKVGGGRNVEEQEKPYISFLSKEVGGKAGAFLYAIPAGWTINPKCEWLEFIREANRIVKRGLLKWDDSLADLLVRVFKVPRWFADKLPNMIGREYL